MFCIQLSAQSKKTLTITKTAQPPKIDGVLNEQLWDSLDVATDFVQFRPDVGNTLPKEQRTEVKISYDDDAIYVAAYLYDDPTKVMRQFNSRDNFGQSDFFLLILNPNNDGLNDTKFFVFSSGNQADAISANSDDDFGWNAVWESAVKMQDDGWTVEMKIPYRTLRFSNKSIQTWGLQFHRQFRRHRSFYSWNPIDISVGNSGLYHGELKGIHNIKPPTRLIFYPFTSGLVNSFDGKVDTEFRVGLDVKYGITENFTLDATLIPDFSQAGFDNLELNLGPFEQTFSEQRQFFTEGVNLFNKGNLFFSRRVGSAPTGEANLNDNEEVINPINTVKVLNAVKVSGRTKKGLGIGIFNAITEKTFATIQDSISGETRKEVVEPFSNYNILVVDKQFNQNSSISIINTNVARKGNFRNANVTGLLADITNKKNTYNFDGEFKMSNIKEADGSSSTGYSSVLGIRKTHGNYRFKIRHEYTDDKYDINDLGLILRNNFNNIETDFWYQTFTPTKNLNRYEISSWLNYRRLANPSTYTGGNVGGAFEAQSKSLHNFGGNINYNFGKQFDYFEPREEGRFFIYENRLRGRAWISTNYNNVFAFDAHIEGTTFFEKGRNSNYYGFSLSPRVRVSDKLLLTYSFDTDILFKERGYATTLNDDIIFGERDRKTATHRIMGRYNFNPFHALELTFRNYWSTVTYNDNLYTLQQNGRLTREKGITAPDLEEDPNINFSTWNLDLNYSWQFAPGSFLTALYRNQLFNTNDASEDSYSDTLNRLFEQPMQHIFSLRLQYFLDYNNAKKVFKKKTDS